MTLLIQQEAHCVKIQLFGYHQAAAILQQNVIGTATDESGREVE